MKAPIEFKSVTEEEFQDQLVGIHAEVTHKGSWTIGTSMGDPNSPHYGQDLWDVGGDNTYGMYVPLEVVTLSQTETIEELIDDLQIEANYYEFAQSFLLALVVSLVIFGLIANFIWRR